MIASAKKESPRKSGVQVIGMQELTHLSNEEESLLRTCESVITEYLAAFFEVGSALTEIRDRGLYRAGFGSFEEYWGIGRHNAYRQIQGAAVMKHLLTMVNTPLPKSERQIRPLVGLGPELTCRIWELAVQNAKGKNLTGKMVEEAARSLGTCKNRGRNRDSWQQLVAPLLREALRQVEIGDRESVRDLLYKATLRLDVGGSRSIEVVPFAVEQESKVNA